MSQTLHEELPDNGIQFELYFEPVGEKRMWKMVQHARDIAAWRKLLVNLVHTPLA